MIVPDNTYTFDWTEGIKVNNNHFYIDHINVADDVYTVDGITHFTRDLHFITDETLLVGNYNETFKVDDDGDYIEVNPAIYENAVKAGDTYFKYWEAGWIINDFPKPILFEFDESLEVLNVVPMDFTTSIESVVQSEDGVYAFKYTGYDEGGILYELIENDSDAIESNEYKQFFTYFMEESTHVLLFAYVFFHFSRYDRKNEKNFLE